MAAKPASAPEGDGAWELFEPAFTAKAGKETDLPYPGTDVEVRAIKRDNRSIEPSLTEEPSKISFVKFIQDSYVQDWSQVNLAKSVKETKSVQPPLPLDEFEYEVDVKSYSETIKPTKLFGKDTGTNKQPTRSNLFGSFFMPDPVPVYSRKTVAPQEIESQQRTEFGVHCKEVTFENGLAEPTFATLALWDSGTGKRITEDFHFTLTHPDNLELVSAVNKFADSNSKARKAIFTVDSGVNKAKIFFVLTITKVLRGDLESQMDHYMKSSLKDKEKQKVTFDAHETIRRLAKYRQHLAIAAAPLAKADGTIQTGNIVFDQIVRIKEVKALLEEVADGKKLKNVIPGKAVIEVTTPPNPLFFVNRISPSLGQVTGFSERDSDRTKEVQEFSKQDPSPFASYVNNLYFYPKKLDFNSLPSGMPVSYRNVALEIKLLDNDDNPEQPGLKVIYGDTTSASLTDRWTSSVWYHNTKPKFMDEVKMKLPLNLSEKHHILITYYHINCKPPSKKGAKTDEPASVIAYSYIPLFQKNKIAPLKGLAAIAPKLSRGYLAGKDGFFDNKKVVLKFATRLESTVFPLDTRLLGFVRYANIEPSSELTHQGLRELATVEISDVCRFMPIVFKSLFNIIACNTNTPENRIMPSVAFLTLVSILQKISELPQGATYLQVYVSHSFNRAANDTQKPLFECLCDQWLIALKGTPEQRLLTIKGAPLLFGVIIKSMVYHAQLNKHLEDPLSRPNRYSVDFIDLLFGLVVAFATHIKELNTNKNIAPYLPPFNVAVAQFLSDLVCIIDRGAAFELIFNYFLEFDEPKTPEMFALKAMALKVFATHPHYLALNLPRAPVYKNVRELLKTYLQHHFFAGLLLTQLELAFDSGNPTTRKLALDLFSEILHRHDHDPAYLSDDNRARICQLYLPFIVQTIDRFELVTKQIPTEERRKVLASFMFVLKGLPRKVLRDYWEKETEKRTLMFFQLIVMALEEFEFKGKEAAAAIRSLPFTSNPFLAVQNENGAPQPNANVSAAAVATISSAGENADGNRTVRQMRSKRRLQIEKKEKKKQKQKDKEADGPTLISPGQALLSASKAKALGTFGGVAEIEVKKEGVFCREVSLIACDVVLIFIYEFSKSMRRKEIFEGSWTVLVHLFKSRQDIGFLGYLMDQLSELVPQYRHHLFSKSNSICGEIIHYLLRKCNSIIDTTRNAAASLYVRFIENNMAETRNVDRCRLQSTIAIIKLVGEKTTSEADLARILDCMSVIAGHFSKQPELAGVIKQLDGKIRTIIADNQKMQKYKFDPETMADLYFKISSQLADSPDERISWLENLSNYHKVQKQVEESAQTKIVTAALAQAYLQRLGRWETEMVPAWNLVCPGLSDELELPSLPGLQTMRDEVCQTALFSTEGFAKLIQESIDMLKAGGFFESCVQAYRMMLPIYLESENYQKQREIYHDLLELTNKLTDETQLKQRIFSNYYRVAFFGSKFGEELNGKEFVYKELNTTRVADVTERLMTQFQKVFGQENVVLLPNTQDVDQSKLDSSKCYLQICNVELYLTKELLVDRKTTFKQHFGCQQFVMEQPFTKTGKAHGEMEDQYIRRTIFTTERPFPYLKKRLLVVNREIKELSPIENALVLIEKKWQFLKNEMMVSAPNIKTLQRELQGTLLTQVNAGPAAVITTFLTEEAGKKWPEDTRNQLADVVIEFERALGFAVRLNKAIMDPSADQQLLHEELEKGYLRFKSVVESLPIFERRKEAKAKQMGANLGDPASQKRLQSDDTKQTLRAKAGKSPTNSAAPSPSPTLTNMFKPPEKPVPAAPAEKSLGSSSESQKPSSSLGSSLGVSNSKDKKRKSDRPSSRDKSSDKDKDRPQAPSPSTPSLNKDSVSGPISTGAVKPASNDRKLPRSVSDNPAERTTIKPKDPAPAQPAAAAVKPPASAVKLPAVNAKPVDPLPLQKVQLAPGPTSPNLPSPGAKAKMAAAVQTLEFLTQSLLMDLDTFAARVSIAMEVAELKPLLVSVKTVKEELGSIKTVVQLSETEPAPAIQDKFELVKAVLNNEFKVIRKALVDIRPVVPHLPLDDLTDTLKALRNVRAELNK